MPSCVCSTLLRWELRRAGTRPITSQSSINGAAAPRRDPGSRCVPMSRLLAQPMVGRFQNEAAVTKVLSSRIKYTVKKTILQALDRDPTAITSPRAHGMECANGR